MLPPGIQMRAMCERDGITFEMRLLGDDERGYLISGDVPGYEELLTDIWFANLDGALATARSLGIEASDWSEIRGAAF